MPKLAINGGEPIRQPYQRKPTTSNDVQRAVNQVLMSGVLSDYLAAWGDKFLGGQAVRRLEERWAHYFNAKHAVAVNSATSGLVAACGAAGISPGDEVIVSPYTMIASATAPLWYGGIPVFADIDPDTYCITNLPVTERTKAIIAVDLFGHPADYDAIRRAAPGVTIIEDAAQALGASYHGKPAGTLADIGVYSLNYHKHIHSGEGGVVVSHDDNIALRLQLIRNHAEACVGAAGVTNLVNMLGGNWRMGEIEATIVYERLQYLPAIVHARQMNAGWLRKHLTIPGLTMPTVAKNTTHAWYLFAMKYDAETIGIPRDVFCKAVQAEGFSLVPGYVKPIYLEPMFQKRMAIGNAGYPFSLRPDITYPPGLCPTAERMHFHELIYTNVIHEDAGPGLLSQFVDAIAKVIENKAEL